MLIQTVLLLLQVRKFKPSLVSISDASKVAQLKELIKDVQPQPESAPLLCFTSLEASHPTASQS
jgi:hypothetical protein